jgi:crotonobetainyl-CoA:carnitine CoA-transferase CaiB-like acyl-CoA transferase
MDNREALEAVMTAWCAERTQAEVMDVFTAAEAAIGPVMSMADISVDPHYAAAAMPTSTEPRCKV